jgi:pyruvate/2-oxoglutarate dehydrogenase complex dihydrolipoamide dehydrogenase (E3) component
MIGPVDEHTQRLLAQVRPPGWSNPTPASIYDLVVIGGGTAGLVCAAGAAGLGARVALIERERLGGDCLNTGCVPSKALIRSARAVAEARAAAAVGLAATASVNFDRVMARVRARRADLAANDSAARMASLGVDVFFGNATFEGPRRIRIAGMRLRFRAAVIATGSRPDVPAIPGLDEVPYLTNESLFALSAQPGDLVVMGAGPIGCEMAQAFALLGSHVTLIEKGPRVLPRDDPEASRLVQRRLERDGVRVLTSTTVLAVRRDGVRVSVDRAAGTTSADALLVATGRVPVIDGLGLELAGVRAGPDGVEVNDRLQTSNSRVYAAGDVCSRYKFTHAADAMARIVVQNALFFGRRRVSALRIPWCTFTSPEVAQVGVAGDEAKALGARAITVELDDVDRAVVDEETDGFVRIHHQRGRLVGATIVAPHAGELIATLTLAMLKEATLKDLAATVFPYPTLALAFKRAGDLYRRESVTARVRAILGRYFAITRRL